MQIEKNFQKHVNVQRLALCAILSATSILMGKYLALNIGESIRLSFENLPILLAGFYLGPLSGAVVGIVADLVGCLLVGYSINPIITIGAAAIGVLSGFAGTFKFKSRFQKVLITVIPAHVVGSVLIKTAGLVIFYRMPFLATLGWRALTYAMISIPETALMFALTGSHAISTQMKRFASTKNL
ncbi:MAG: folate family ECF transporter S component [Clostridia bacterium]|nr:folate family ECF transporter S component [Clostridia bacterium]